MADDETVAPTPFELIGEDRTKRKGTWTPEQAREAAQKSVEARRAKKEAQEKEGLERKELVKLKIAGLPSRDELGKLATAVVADVFHALLSGEIKPRTVVEASKVAEVAFNILRLEGDQSTSITEHLTSEDRRDTLVALRDEATRRLQVVPPSA